MIFERDHTKKSHYVIKCVMSVGGFGRRSVGIWYNENYINKTVYQLI